MNLPRHQMPRPVFTALAAGEGGTPAIRELVAAEYSKHVTFLWGVVTAARGSAQYPLARAGYDLLTEASRVNPAAAERVIRHPSVGAWARRTILASRGGQAAPGTEPHRLRAVGAAAAIRAGLSAEIEVAVSDGRIMLPSLGAAMAPGHDVLVRSGPGHAHVGEVELPADPHSDGPGWHGLRQVRAGSLDVLIDDLDPFRMPDMQDLEPRVDAQPWDTVLQNAWLVLEQNHPEVAAEIGAAVSVIVPRRRPPHGEVSTSSPEAFGAIALSLPPDPVTCAVTLAHEVQHLKLGAVLDLVSLTLPDDGRRYYAPWRDDPRPLNGLLQGAYAHLGVTRFWRRQRELPGSPPRADVEYARWRTATALAIETIQSSGRLTDAGLEFVGEMGRTLRHWEDEPVPDQALAVAQHAAELHLSQWQAENGPIPVR